MTEVPVRSGGVPRRARFAVMRLPNPVRALTRRFGASLWAWRGGRCIRRGDWRGGIRAYQAALRRRPEHFGTLLHLARAHLCAREVHEARRFLLLAREADPKRYEFDAAAFLARHGFDLESICRIAPTTARPAEPVRVRASRSTREPVTPENLPYGDCRDLDEYARFRAMPPITPAEAEGLDWDRVIDDLLDE